MQQRGSFVFEGTSLLNRSYAELKGNRANLCYTPLKNGAVTTGTDWKFLKLTDKTVFIDKRDYFINEVSRILGILTTPFKKFHSIQG